MCQLVGDVELSITSVDYKFGFWFPVSLGKKCVQKKKKTSESLIQTFERDFVYSASMEGRGMQLYKKMD